MKTIKIIYAWANRHKLLAFIIVAFADIVIANAFGGVNSYALGEMWGILFCVFLLTIWSYAGIKRLCRKQH